MTVGREDRHVTLSTKLIARQGDTTTLCTL